MTGEGLLLIEELIRLAQSKSTLSDGALDDLKARFLLLTSSSPESLAQIDRLRYGVVTEDESQNEVGERSGIILDEANILLSDFIIELMQLPDTALADMSFSPSEFRSGLKAMLAIALCVQWSSFDHMHIARYDRARERRALDSTLGTLSAFRKTGDV